MPLPLVGLGIGAIGAIGKMFSRGRANRELDKVLAQDPTYTENPIARQRKQLADALLNARMPGASALEKNIYTSGANALGAVQRNATDSSQLLSLGAGIYGQEGQQFENLSTQEAQDYQRRYGNYVEGGNAVINEGDKIYQDKIRRFNDLASIRGAQASNRASNWGDISNLGFGLADFGLSGGFGKGRQQRNMSGGAGNMYNSTGVTGGPNFQF